MNEGETNTVRVTIDGVVVDVPPAVTVLQAAERAGVVVPHYCYHPGIPTRPAQCRMCLVEVEGQPKLQPSCVLPVRDGMVVRTDAPEARRARRSVIEFLLLNHPLDCPICDAAGQCMLQDYAFETGQLRSRYEEAKLVLGRDRVADDILYFADRCIICTRCVRFMRDVAEDDSLVVAQRGHKAYIDTFPGAVLDHPFRGNIVDVCPVGALVHEDFVFKARAWDMDSAPSICPGCSTGCNVNIDVKENQIVRVKPRYNPEVNAYWMCDYGRKHLVSSSRGVRAERPMVRRDGELTEVGWEEALRWVAQHVEKGSGGVALVSAREACENLFYLRRLLTEWGIPGGTYRVGAGDEVGLAGFPKLRLRADRAANVEGASLFGFQRSAELPVAAGGETLIVMGDGLADAPEDYGSRSAFFLFIGSHLSPVALNATAVLPATTFAEMEGTFLNYERRLQRFHQAMQPPGVARPGWMLLSHLLGYVCDSSGALEVSAAFAAMTEGTPVLEGLSWEGLGLRGERLADAGMAVLAGERAGR